MKNFVLKNWKVVMFLALVPFATFTNLIGKGVGLDSTIILSLQIPMITTQLFCCYL